MATAERLALFILMCLLHRFPGPVLIQDNKLQICKNFIQIRLALEKNLRSFTLFIIMLLQVLFCADLKKFQQSSTCEEKAKSRKRKKT